MSGFGGHGERGAAIAICCWLALGLPRAVSVAAHGEGAVRWLGFGFLAFGALIAWLGIRRFDEGVGCLSAIGIGAGFWVASRLAPRLSPDPVREGLIGLAGAFVAAFSVVGVLLGSMAAWDRLSARTKGTRERPTRPPAVRNGAPADATTATARETASGSPAPPPPKEPSAERQVGPFRVRERIETDGFLSVYRALDDAGVAFNLQQIHSPRDLDDFDESRFTSAAQRLASVRHAYLVSVRDFGVERDAPWLAFDLWPPETLTELLRRSRLEPSRAMKLIAEGHEPRHRSDWRRLGMSREKRLARLGLSHLADDPAKLQAALDRELTKARVDEAEWRLELHRRRARHRELGIVYCGAPRAGSWQGSSPAF